MNDREEMKTSIESNEHIIKQLKQLLESGDHLHINNNEESSVTKEEQDNENETNSNFGIKELKLIVTEYEILKDTFKALEKKNEENGYESENRLKTIEEQKSQIRKLQENNRLLQEEIKSLKTNFDRENSSREELSNAFQKTIDRLEGEVKTQKALVMEANEKLTAHDTAAKRAIAVLQKEMSAKVEQVNTLYKDSLADKDSQIIKISKLEALNDDLKQDIVSQSKKVLEQQNELDTVRASLKAKQNEIKTIFLNSESHEKEFAKLNKKIESLQEEVKNQETKVKWAQNKLAAELDAHKETKKQISQLQGKLKQAKEEGDMIRKDCQQMIERYQGDEEIKSVRLDKELEENIVKLKSLAEELTKQEELNKEQQQAINIIRNENQKLDEDLSDKKSQVFILEGKNKKLQVQFEEKTKDYAEMKTQLDDMKEKMKNFDGTQLQLKEHETKILELQSIESVLRQQLHDAEFEVKEQSEKQQEILQYSQNLTENNVSAKAVAADLQARLETLLQENGEVHEKFKKSEEENRKNMEALQQEKNGLFEELQTAKISNEQKQNKIEEVTSSLEEARDEMKMLKKKNTALVKDLQRQLQQTTRKIVEMESTSNGSIENLSIRSRTPSCNSLEKIQSPESPPNYSSSPQLNHDVVMMDQDHYINQPNKPSQQQFPEVEIDKKVLIERICKLQRVLARKREKLEFMEEHINQLTEELQKKSKIIQHYALKEEAGSLAPDRYDRVKAEVSQYGGIMASVYSAKLTDKGMNLELSLEINKKLQALLEDLILKNITLKENVNTLGDEIARLTTELSKIKNT